MLTGVSKFSNNVHTSDLFSNQNNLTDITMNKKYGTITGYTQDDLNTTFKEHLKYVDMDIAIDCDVTKEEFLNKKIKFVTSMISMGYDLKIDLVQYPNNDKLLSDKIRNNSILI